MAATAILDFQNFNFSTVRTVRRVELHHYAKFCRNRFNRGRDIAIFRFFKMAAAAMLNFKKFKFLTIEKVKKVKVHQCARFRRNRFYFLVNIEFLLTIFSVCFRFPPSVWRTAEGLLIFGFVLPWRYTDLPRKREFLLPLVPLPNNGREAIQADPYLNSKRMSLGKFALVT